MRLSRRSLLTSLLFAAAAGSAVAAGPRRGRPASLLVYDSRWPQSRALCGRLAEHAVDVAHEHAHRWQSLRTVPAGGTIIGLTSWSDLVLARTLLQERGRRLRSETRCGNLFYWEMA